MTTLPVRSGPGTLQIAQERLFPRSIQTLSQFASHLVKHLSIRRLFLFSWHVARFFLMLGRGQCGRLDVPKNPHNGGDEVSLWVFMLLMVRVSKGLAPILN